MSNDKHKWGEAKVDEQNIQKASRSIQKKKNTRLTDVANVLLTDFFFSYIKRAAIPSWFKVCLFFVTCHICFGNIITEC